MSSSSAPRSIAIVGAGVGGLSVAARLAHAGHEVTVFEKNGEPGGRCGILRDRGYTWDIGPTLLLMPEVVREVFTATGRDPDEYLNLVQCDPNYRIHFADGSDVTFSTNLPRMRDELERIEPGAFERYLRFLAFGRHAYDTSLAEIVSRPLDTAASYLHPGLLSKLFSLKAHRRLYPYLRGLFRDERLLRAMSFQTMYLGISPFESLATFALLPYTELAMGVWYPRGGLYQVPRALERLGREFGVSFRYNTAVRRIVAGTGRVEGITTDEGGLQRFDVVIANADLPYVYEKLIPEAVPRRSRKQRFTSSAFMLYLGLDRRYEHVEHHNVIFGEKYRETFQDIFHDHVIPADPSFYVNRPTRSDPAMAPPGCDALYVLTPVPHQTPHVSWIEAAPKLRDRMLGLLEQRLGMEDLAQHVRVSHTLTPDGWAERFNLKHGAAFGLSHDFGQVGAFRPSTRDPKFRNLYFVGASTQPGTGLPLVMLSARIVATRLARELEQLPSGSRSATGVKLPLAEAA
jgi:phytoene desaturase